LPVLNQIRKAWNAFISNDQTASTSQYSYGTSVVTKPDRPRLRFYNEKTIISSIFTRISIDVAAIDIRHTKVDENGRYLNDIDSALNMCFQFEANTDQAPRHFKQDAVLSLFDKGVIAIVPVDTSNDPVLDPYFDVFRMRVGEINNWFPKHIRVSVYDENDGQRKDLTLPKRNVAIVENPLYSVMNEPNSTLQRLVRKLSLLDSVDEQSSSGKLDLIIQLPYVIKSEARRQQAEQRRSDIEFQLKGSQYGIAYTDGTEKITQLNRPSENNLMKQVEYLTQLLYSQLGITEEVMNGTADEKTMLNYHSRTIEPIVEALVQAMQRAFIGRERTKEKEKILYFKDPFKLVPVSSIADVADKFTRNEILTSNEIRGFIGVVPSNDPKADKLQNSNMPQATADQPNV
jgi:hypothetical protein